MLFVLIELQMGQLQQEQQLDKLQADIDRVIGWLRRFCPVDDGQGAGVQHGVEQGGLRCQQCINLTP